MQSSVSKNRHHILPHKQKFKFQESRGGYRPSKSATIIAVKHELLPSPEPWKSEPPIPLWVHKLSVLQNLFFVSPQILLSSRSWRKWDTNPCHQLFSVCYIRYFVGNFNVRLMVYHALSRWIASTYQPHILFKPLRSILILISFIVVGK